MAEATRPPEGSDLVRLCAEPDRLQAKYIVIGGLAMNELGLVRVTEGIDLLIEPSIENQELIRQALRILPERAIDELGLMKTLSDIARGFVPGSFANSEPWVFQSESQFSSFRPDTLLNSRTFPVTRIPFSAITVAATR